MLWKSAPGWRHRLLAAAILLASALAAPLIAFLALQTVMPPAQAIRGVLGSWMIWFAPAVTNLLFFRSGLGIDDVPGSLRLLAIGCLCYAVALSAALRPRLGRRQILAQILARSGADFYWRAGAVLVACSCECMEKFRPSISPDSIFVRRYPWPAILAHPISRSKRSKVGSAMLASRFRLSCCWEKCCSTSA